VPKRKSSAVMEIAYFMNFTSNGDTAEFIVSRDANLFQTGQLPEASVE
jgi:hypothetical protein